MQDRRNAKAAWKTAKLVNCIVCGCKFISQRGTARFCCANCQLKYYYNVNAKYKQKIKINAKQYYYRIAKHKIKTEEQKRIINEKQKLRAKKYIKTGYMNTYVKNWRKQKYNSSKKFKIITLLRNRLYNAIKNKRKYSSCIKLLGCSLEQFIVYIEKQFSAPMNWKNYGKVWHIDHIIPCTYFDLTKLEHQKQCFHYTNLRPMIASENLTKKNKIYFGDTFLSSTLLEPQK